MGRRQMTLMGRRQKGGNAPALIEIHIPETDGFI
jgi:hypothetical protein